MPVGDKIRTVDYNTIQSKVANVLGTGTGNLGYGQTVQSSQVNLDNRITVNEWGRLRNDIINIYRHQTNSIPDTSVLPETIAETTVRYNVSNAPITVWDSLSTTLQNNRVNALPIGRFGTATTASRPSQTVSFNASAQVDITFEWNNATEARYFFNSGGRLRISSGFTPSLGTSQNASWQTLLSGIGTREWGGFFPDTTTGVIDGRNWHKSDTTFRTFYSTTASSPYGANTYSLLASKNNQYVYIRILLTDAYTDLPFGDPDNPPPDDLVQGSLSVTTSILYPTGPLTGLGSAIWEEYRPIASSVGTWTSTNSTSVPSSPPPPPTYSETMYFTPNPTNVGNGAFLIIDGAVPNSVVNYAFYTPSGSNTTGTYTLDGSGGGSFFSGSLPEAGTYTIYVSFVGSGNFLSASVNTV